ncbi:leucine-rich repeat domain-containing protein [Oscillatoria salina]|uniref:leucine-rich repeat domain-containing protein n=1 Tax=Oscillatoria salina TaxID=331517 RepID=UPI0013B78A75|nr:leucine-rich repeat domain-containing protein [Oscillatoria salina]MBZ8180121.1 leucine-rich repeat domain-containing protein [Oscillatoria salina IIICB1]NET89581.1 leucine-rich repeat domain-containing protein [Kamptonema sp. SIO1D9]
MVQQEQEEKKIIENSSEVTRNSDVQEDFPISNSQTSFMHLTENNSSKLGSLQSLRHLTHLSLSANQIIDLTPLCSLVNLKWLMLDVKQVSDFSPLRSLNNLEDLMIHNHKISNLEPLSSLLNLVNLQLTSNQINNLNPLQSLSKLKTLFFWNTQISDLSPLRSLLNLKVLHLGNNQISDLSPLKDLPKLKTFRIFRVHLSRKYWTRINEWKAEWLLTETNAAIRRVLIRQIGYKRICSELGATEIDAWREYVLFRIDAEIDTEPIFLLKMIDSSTNDIYFLRVPPNLNSAREAIRWLNHGIDPEEFAIET